jgi:uncharacterized membrane protein YidH (DUF202 family)
MMTFDTTTERFSILVEWGTLTEQELKAAEDTAAARGADLEAVLLGEYKVPKAVLLQALSEYYNCPFVEYDERMPVAPELLTGLDNEKLSLSRWFPVIRDGDTVVIASNDPTSPHAFEEVKASIKAERYEFWVALNEDIEWYVQDFLHARPGLLIGTERTGLAFWRNTMAFWRTRLACYRNDLAKARTSLALLRWGLGFIALADTLVRVRGAETGGAVLLYGAMTAVGLAFGVRGLSGYLTVRRSRMRPPGHHTLVEVTAATLQFLESYHFIEGANAAAPTKGTMLARLGDFLAHHSTILYPSPASRERTHLARERNVLAAQRTIAACYRTLYARGRTGLAFIRTGISFAGLGLGLVRYFGPSLFTAVDLTLVAAGLLMTADGLRWYLPVRKEFSEVPRCPVPM